jgi:hypothetical protein
MIMDSTSSSNRSTLKKSEKNYMVETHRGIIGAITNEGPTYGVVFYVGNGAYTEIGKTAEYTTKGLVIAQAREIASCHEESELEVTSFLY